MTRDPRTGNKMGSVTEEDQKSLLKKIRYFIKLNQLVSLLVLSQLINLHVTHSVDQTVIRQQLRYSGY